MRKPFPHEAVALLILFLLGVWCLHSASAEKVPECEYPYPVWAGPQPCVVVPVVPPAKYR